MIKLAETREITPYRWVHPDEDRKLKAFFLERSWNELNLGPVGFSPGKKGGKHGSETQFHSG